MAAKGPVAEWTVREQLILASAVQRSGDQNWVSVSRAVKPLVEDARPPDYFSQKNCALQYSAMLDKAKHPKRKRSSDGTPDSGVTVEEQIVRQLTEKRITELNSSIGETKKEYYALKKEIEQIESGDMESELPAMWEKMQSELATKEGTDSKGSRVRRSSVPTPTGSVAEGDNPRRQKSSVGTLPADKKSSHKSPEKRSSQSTPEGSSISPAVKEEKPSVVPSDVTHSTPTPTTPSAQRGSSKRRNLENLPLVSGSSTEIVTPEESPLPYPMTVPKEEQLRETIAASGGRLSRSLVLPLSPDMHVIVQQPNIAALSGLTTPPEVDSGAPDVKTQKLPQAGLPAPTPAPPAEAPQPVIKSVDSLPALVVVKQEVKQEPPPSLSVPVSRPKTVAEALSSAGGLTVHPTPPHTQHSSLPPRTTPTAAPPPSSATQPFGLSSESLQRSPLSVSRAHLVTPSPSKESLPQPQTSQSSHSPMKQTHSVLAPSAQVTHSPPAGPMMVVSSVLSDPRLSSRPANTARAATVQFTLHQVLDKGRPMVAMTGQTTPDRTKGRPQATTADKTKSTPQPVQLTTTEKEKSQVVTPLVTSAAPGSLQSQPMIPTAGDISKPPTAKQTAVDQGTPSSQPGTVDKSKPPAVVQQATPDQPEPSPQAAVATTIKSRLLAGPPEKRNTSEEPASQPLANLSVSRSWQDSLPQPSVDIVREPKNTEIRSGAVAPPTEGVETQQQSGMEREGSVGESEVVVDVVTPEEREGEVGKAPSAPRGADVTGGDGQKKEGVCEEGKHSGGGATEDVAVDDQVQMEASSSRRSSTSELPSSPLTGGAREELAPDTEDTLPRRKQAKTSSSRKLWRTRSRKRKLDADERMSVESTDLDSEEEPSSITVSAEPSPAPSQGDGDQESGISKKQWKKAIMLVWRHAAQHKYANLFLHPVRDDDAPGYRDVIHRPMDLSTTKRNIETGVTTTDTEFQRDMLLMFQNAFMYNSSDHDVYDMAEKMRADVMQSIQDYLSTQLQLIVESSTPKVLRSRDKEGRRSDGHDEGLLTPMKKRRTRADD